MLKSSKLLKVLSSFCALCMAASFFCTSPVSAAATRKVGDVDGNGNITNIDAMIIQRHVTKQKVITDSAALKAADVDFDGKVTNKDALLIQRYVLKLAEITPLKDSKWNAPCLNAANTIALKRSFAASQVKVSVPSAHKYWLSASVVKSGSYVTGIKVTTTRNSYIKSRSATITVTVEGNNYNLTVTQTPDGGYRGVLRTDTQYLYDKLVEYYYINHKYADFTVDVSSLNYTVDNYFDKGWAVACTISDDYPEIFWENLGAIGCSITSSGVTTITFKRRDTYQNAYKDIGTFTDRVEQAVKQIEERANAIQSKYNCSQEYANVYAIHEYICLHSNYMPDAKKIKDEKTGKDDFPPVSQAAAPLFGLGDQDHEYVCAGYSSAFKLLCSRFNLPCLVMSGPNHAWNYVQMENGEWYGVDVTWDDKYKGNPTQIDKNAYKQIKYDNFLMGNTFRETHKHDAYVIDGKTFNYPTFETKDYPNKILNIPFDL